MKKPYLDDDACRAIEFKVSQEAPTDPPPNLVQLRRLAMNAAYAEGHLQCQKELAEKCGEKQGEMPRMEREQDHESLGSSPSLSLLDSKIRSEMARELKEGRGHKMSLVESMREWAKVVRRSKGVVTSCPLDHIFPKNREDFLVWAAEQGWLSYPMPHWNRFWQFITPKGELLYVTFMENQASGQSEWEFESIKKIERI